MSMHLYYGHNIDTPVEVANADRLAAELDRVEEESRTAKEPWMAALRDPAGRELALGLGADISVVTWTDEADGETPYLISRGDGAGAEAPAFYYGDWSEFPPSAAVSVDLARRAAHDFVETGKRPNLEWQE